MSKAQFYNGVIYLIATFMVAICSPFIVGLFIAKFTEVTCNYVLDKASTNRCSAYFIRLREESKKETGNYDAVE